MGTVLRVPLLHLYFFHIDLKVNDVVPWVLDLILNKHIISPNPHVRQAACIWLLSLVKKLSTHKAIKVRTVPFLTLAPCLYFCFSSCFCPFPFTSIVSFLHVLVQSLLRGF